MTDMSNPASTKRRSRVVSAARAAGLLDGGNRALGARIPDRLLLRAKERAGIESTTEMIEYALAKVAIEDDFGPRLLTRKGAIPADLELDV